MSIISNMQIPVKIVSVDGEIVSIFLIFILSISFLVSPTKYWNIYVSNTLNILADPMWLIFICIVIFNIIMAIKT